jgi:hypothetical protein
MSPIRYSRFFVNDDAHKALEFADALEAYGHKDVLLTLKKNAEDAARGTWANARVEGVNVHWTRGPRKFSHAVSLAFEIVNQDENGAQFTVPELRKALEQRISSLDANNEWLEAVGCAYDTYEVEDPAGPKTYENDDADSLPQ